MKCLIIACALVVSAATGVLATPVNNERDIFCPPGDKDYGHGPVCSIHDCSVCPHFPGCGTEIETHALLSKRHSECPPGSHCGHGPVCSIHDCDLCPNFPGCGTEVEHRAVFLAKRQLECPAGLDCDFAPDCTMYDCDKYPSLRGCSGEVELRSIEVERDAQTALSEQSCALVCNKDRCLYVPEPEKEKRNPQDDLWCFINPNDQDVCMIPYAAKKAKRAAETDFVLPCPFICDQQGECVCIGENNTDTTEKEKRAAETDRILPCPFICDQQGTCVCTWEDITAVAEKEKRAAGTDFIHPCPYICDENGVCACTEEKEKRTTETDPFLPYPFDCNEHGTCTCHKFDGNRKCCVAPENNTNDCIITQRDTEFVQKRDTAFIHPCPLICDNNGHCDCAAESPSVDKTIKRDTDYRGPPCPSGNLICMNTGCKCGGPFITPLNGPPTAEKRDEAFRGPPCPTGSLTCNTLGCKCSGPPHVPIHGPPTSSLTQTSEEAEQ